MKLCIALDKGDLITVWWLINKANVNSYVIENDIIQRRPLHFAAYHGYFRIVALLIQKGADVNVRDVDGYTPLHKWAYEGSCIGTAKILIKSGADINALDYKNRYTPLYQAIRCSCVDGVRYLIAAGSDVYVKSKYGNALQLALAVGKRDIIELILIHIVPNNFISSLLICSNINILHDIFNAHDQ